MKTLYEYIEILDEISRRGFLKGILATAAGAAASQVNAEPFRHVQQVDQMTGKTQGNVSIVKSDNSNAILKVSWGDSKLSYWASIYIPNSVINYRSSQVGSVAPGRIKIGDSPVETINMYQSVEGDYSHAFLGFDYNKNDKQATRIARNILNANGKVKIEVPIYRDGPRVFDFTIEQDAITQQFSKDDRTKQDRENKIASVSAEQKEKIHLIASNFAKQRLQILADEQTKLLNDRSNAYMQGHHYDSDSVIRAIRQKEDRVRADIDLIYNAQSYAIMHDHAWPEWFLVYAKTGKWPSTAPRKLY